MSADDQHVARHGDRAAELVAAADMMGLEVGLLRPNGAAADEDIGGSGIPSELVGRGVDSGGAAVFIGGPHHCGVA